MLSEEIIPIPETTSAKTSFGDRLKNLLRKLIFGTSQENQSNSEDESHEEQSRVELPSKLVPLVIRTFVSKWCELHRLFYGSVIGVLFITSHNEDCKI